MVIALRLRLFRRPRPAVTARPARARVDLSNLDRDVYIAIELGFPAA